MGDAKKGADGVGWVGVVVFGVMGWGGWIWLGEWWAVNGVVVLAELAVGGPGGRWCGFAGFGCCVVVETLVCSGWSGAGGGGVVFG